MKNLSYLLIFLLPFTAHAQDSFECPDEFEGYYPHDLSCDKYWECRDGVATLETCGNGLAFDDRDESYTTKNCDYLYNVECGARTEVEPPISAPNCPRLYGTFDDPDDCTAFYNCRDGHADRFTCAPGLAYDLDSRVCKWKDQIKRCKDEVKEDEESAGGQFVCPNNVPVGIFSKHAHPEDCRQYFVCISGTPREYGCPLGTVFKVGDSEFDGKCADPEEVPECKNYYGDLEFDKQELVRAGVDPEAVGAKVAPAPRVRVNSNRKQQRRPKPVPVIDDYDYLDELAEEKEEEEQRFVPLPPARTRPGITRTNTNSFRTRPSRINRPVPTTTRATTTTTTTTTTPTTTRRPPPPPPSPSRLPLPSLPSEVPAIPLSSLNVDLRNGPAQANSAKDNVAPGSLGTPAKVKAGDDYYYYYYYYDDEENPGDADTVA